MKLQKWNYDTQKYEDYEIPNTWLCPIYTDNLERVINCTSCGKLLRYGSCYTSMTIHNRHGFGYPICKKCYFKNITKEPIKKYPNFTLYQIYGIKKDR